MNIAAESTASQSGAPRTGRASAPCPAGIPPSDPLNRRYGKRLPRGLRREAAHLSWDEFESAYTCRDGRFRLDELSRRSQGVTGHEYTAAVTDGDTVRRRRARAHGAASVLTALLHEAGVPLEIAALHQQRLEADVATFLLCVRGRRRRWAMGLGAGSDDSIADALVSGANLLTD